MWRSPEPSPGSGGRPGLRATHAAWRRWWQPPKASLDHPGDAHFCLLKPISIPWLRNGQNWPKGRNWPTELTDKTYPNQTKPNQPIYWSSFCLTRSSILLVARWKTLIARQPINKRPEALQPAVRVHAVAVTESAEAEMSSSASYPRQLLTW